jgi:hypothetical protein|nr:MAG TPA: hypothetical protein [Caudoviricetes sp.]
MRPECRRNFERLAKLLCILAALLGSIVMLIAITVITAVVCYFAHLAFLWYVPVIITAFAIGFAAVALLLVNVMTRDDDEGYE